MNQLEIYIDKTLMNYQRREGFPLALTLSIESAEDPSRLNGAHTKRTVEFPGDGDTRLFFEEWATPGRVNPSAAKQKPARIEVNGVVVFTGVAQLEEAKAIGGPYSRTGGTHRVALLGNNATWFADLQEKAIRDLGLMPVHDLTEDVVSARDNADPDGDSWGYFLFRGRDWTTPGEVSYTEMQPFLFVRTIITEAFRLAGYRFSSDFFDTDFGKRLILPVLFRPYSEDFIQQWSIYIMDNANGTVITPGSLFDLVTSHITISGDDVLQNPTGLYDTSTGYYTVPISGYYIVAVPKPLASLVYFSIRINDTTTIYPVFTDDFAAGTGVQGRVYLEQGDLVDLVALTLNVAPDPIVKAFLYIVPDVNAFEPGTTVDFAKYGDPGWFVGGMILGMTHAFGLVWNTDYDAQTVRCEPRDRYLIRKRSPDTTEPHDGFYHHIERMDVTQRVDLSKDAAVTNITSINERLRMSWQSDGADGNIGALDGEGALKLYDGSYQFPADRFQVGESVFENPFFSKTIHVFEASVKHESSTVVPQLPVFQESEYGAGQTEIGDFAPRLLYFAGRRDGLDGYVTLGGAAYDFPAAWMVNYNDVNGYDPCLSFANQTLLNGTAVPGLLQVFHLQYLKRIEQGKQVSEWLRWSPLDVLNLDFRTKVLLNGSLYLLQKVNGYKPLSQGSTETVLLLDAIPEASDLDKVSGSPIMGYIPLNQ